MYDGREKIFANHFAKFISRIAQCDEESCQKIKSLVEELVLAMHNGHSCLPVNETQGALLTSSHLAITKNSVNGSQPNQSPFVIENKKLYLHKYYLFEYTLAKKLITMAAVFTDDKSIGKIVSEVCGDHHGEDLQREAARMAARRNLTIISGGPGTGKTTTVAKILLVIKELYGNSIRIALAAPTGKAAMRLQQSLQKSFANFRDDHICYDDLKTNTFTLHRLLGIRQGKSRHAYSEDNPMHWDVVIVDEASMIDLAMMSKLVGSLKEGAKLILLGDQYQLASVEAGSVLADMTKSLPSNSIQLKKTYRFDISIEELAESIKRGEAETFSALSDDTSIETISSIDDRDLLKHISEGYAHYIHSVTSKTASYEDIFHSFNTFSILCPTHSGKYGVEWVNRYLEQYVVSGREQDTEWYEGRPVLITRNSYQLNLFNGDIGLCLPDDTESDKLMVWFEDGDGGFKKIYPYRLPEHQTAYALTIHKSQGSEFGSVLVLLPDQETELLTRELLYTAVTRAKKEVAIFDEKKNISFYLSRRAVRFSGLAEMITCGAMEKL